MSEEELFAVFGSACRWGCAVVLGLVLGAMLAVVGLIVLMVLAAVVLGG